MSSLNPKAPESSSQSKSESPPSMPRPRSVWDNISPVHGLILLIILAFLFKDTAVGNWALSVLPDSIRNQILGR
jgi:hypothetical protein